MNAEEAEGSASPPSPLQRRPRHHPSPLPISRGPDNENYSFSQSPSLSPPVSPPGSCHSSAESLSLVDAYKFSDRRSLSAPSSYFLDRIQPSYDSDSERTSCLKELLEWFVLKCCICCSWNINSTSKLHQS